MNNYRNHSDHLTDQELRDYLEGKVKGKEAHYLERHLADCELCSDALEGLETLGSETVFEDVDGLRNEIQKKSRTRTSTGWTLRIAASLIILALSTFVLINFLKEDPQQEITSSEETIEEPPQEEEFLASDKPDTFEIQEQVPLAQIKEESEEELAAGDPEGASGAGPAVTDESGIAALDEDSIATADLADFEIAEDLVEEPIAEAQPLEEEPKPEEAIQEEIVKVEEPQRTDAKRAAKALREEPVQATRPLAYSADALVAEPAISINAIQEDKVYESNAEPIDGTEIYVQQILEEITYPREASDEEIRGTVILQFQVESTGVLSTFEIIQRLGYGCDEEALRVIKEGPGWKAAILEGNFAAQAIQIKIRFPASSQ